MRSAHRLTLGLTVSALFAGGWAAAADLDVGPGQAYATIQAAVSAAVPGDAVVVHAGSYIEDLDLASEGSADMRLTLRGAGDGTVTIQGAHRISGSFWDVADLVFAGPSGADAFRITGDYNRLTGIELSGGDRDGIDGAGIGNEVRGSSIHDFDAGMSDAHCIVLNPGAEDWIIDDNDLYDCSGDAIQLYANAAERTIINTTVSNNRMYWSGAIGRMENAVDIKNADGLSITRNLMYGFMDNKTIVAQKGPRGIEVRCNEIHGGLTGIEFRGEDGGTVEDVVFTRNLVHDMMDYGLKFDGTVGAQVFSNTFVGVASDGLRLEGAGLTNGTVRNNLWNTTGAIDGGAGVTADHNAFFMTGSVGISSATDVTGDPLLGPLYEPMAGSPLIDAGGDIAEPFAGAAPDIGFAEVGLDACGDIGGTGGEGGGASSGSGASGGSGGPGAGAGANGSGGSNGAGGAGAADGPDDGCSCRTPGGTAQRTHWAVLALGLAITLLRRGDAGSRRA